VLAGAARPWQLGVLYVEETALSRGLLDVLRRGSRWVVGDNEPYSLLKTYSESMTCHGIRRGIPALEIEIRQDLLATSSQRREWAQELARALRAVSRD
jgi:predicted N-formylglutamate amidohydrolase